MSPAASTACVGDVVATRRNDRRLTTTAGEPVRNRDTWTVTGIGRDGSITVSHQGGHGTVTLPADYTREHVRFGYAATEHGWQSDTVATGMCLASPATTRRGLYVAVTRGRDENVICVITDSNDIAEARDVLDGIVAVDRADIPAVTQRRTLAQQQRGHDIPTTAPPSPRDASSRTGSRLCCTMPGTTSPPPSDSGPPEPSNANGSRTPPSAADRVASRRRGRHCTRP